MTVTSLVVAVAALAVAGWALARTYRDPAPAYTEAQRAAAKDRICAAVELVRSGVSLNTNLQSPGGPADATGAMAAAANARISLYDGGQYLLARLDPATDAELADAVRTFADTLVDIGAAATAGALNTDPDQAARIQQADAAQQRIATSCA
ncbi:hypothetical protein LV457_07305 [Mycobacterium sp. MYCO198283]|nr:hypothetical protein [Mycobacterium sp. MYCO198283]MCG5432098.1 hypothetical protein [Mycobacterium sp. MYCO198283]